MSVSKKPIIKVTAAIITNGGEFLICQRPKNKSCGLLWEFPGGKIEPGETAENCIIRECNEELGINLESVKHYCNISYEYEDKIVDLSFHTALLKDRASIMIKEHNAIEWIGAQDVKKYDFCPADKKMLDIKGLIDAQIGDSSKKQACPRCGSTKIYRDGKNVSKGISFQRFRCNDCKKRFSSGLYEENQIIHFGVKLKANDSMTISRESFSEPSYRISYAQRKILELRIAEGLEKVPNDIYEDDEHYTDKYVKKHSIDCGINYDINMKYFTSLDEIAFRDYLTKFTEKNRLSYVDDLTKVNNTTGVYLLVLGQYKQVYIGQSSNIKRRILQHWSNKKEFDRRIFGRVEDSILPIDSFGALDTTEIYYKESTIWDINELEEKLVRRFDQKYLLNRVAGGINGEFDDSYRKVMLAGSARHRRI